MEETLTKCKFYSLVRYYLVILLQQHPSQIGHWLSYTVTTHPWSNLARPILLYCYITSDCHGRIDYSTSDQLHIMGGVADNSHLSSVISNISTYLSSFTVNTFHWAFLSLFLYPIACFSHYPQATRYVAKLCSSNISRYLSSFTVNAFHWASLSLYVSHSLFLSLSASHKICSKGFTSFICPKGFRSFNMCSHVISKSNVDFFF